VSRTQYFTAASLDGFLADENGSLDWLFRVEHGDSGGSRWDSFFPKVGAMAMGATTYRWAVDHDKLLDNPERWRSYYGDVPCWIFANGDVPLIPGADLRVVGGDVVPVHRTMSAVAGERNIWIVGGGDLVGQFHDAGLLDDILVSLAPVTLGAGAPLLPRHIEGMRVASVRQDGQRVDIHYTLDDVQRAR
jgi:dihydrofolate reductase